MLPIGFKVSRVSRGPAFAAFLLTGLLLGVLQHFARVPMLLAERFWPGAGWLQVLLMALYAGRVASMCSDPATSTRIRPRIWALFSLAFFGQLALGLAGFEKMLMTGKLHLPLPALIIAGPLYRGSDFFMPILFAVTVLLAGPAWCSYLCYFGAWDDQCSRRLSAIKELPVWWQRLRFGVLLLVIFMALTLRFMQTGWATAFGVAAVFGLTGLGIMAVLSRRHGLLVHCTMYCPVGLLGNWLGRLSPWRMKIAEGCSGCLQCRKVCRYSALSITNIKARQVGSSCTLCGDCVAACHTGQINYSLPFSVTGSEKARAVFVVLITTLHAVFLAVARI